LGVYFIISLEEYELGVKKNRIWFVLFLLPTIILFLFFYAYPIFAIAFTSFANWKLGTNITFAGFDNFKRMIADPNFRDSLQNTLWWLLLHLVVLVGVSILVALLTFDKSRFSKAVRAIYLIPNALPLAVIGFLFYFIFNPSIGLVNGLVHLFGYKDFALNWYQDAHTAFFTVTVTTILYGGVYTLLMSAEMTAIPEEIFESVKIDGANNLQTNLYIIIPLIKNILGTVLILAAVQCLKTFEVIYLTTSGGPGNSTMNLPILIYRTAMNNSDFSYANSISLVTILIGMVTIGVISKLFKVGKKDF
jgi:raffinose/stachyose/melibiose transport system permease protein